MVSMRTRMTISVEQEVTNAIRREAARDGVDVSTASQPGESCAAHLHPNWRGTRGGREAARGLFGPVIEVPLDALLFQRALGLNGRNRRGLLCYRGTNPVPGTHGDGTAAGIVRAVADPGGHR